MATVRNRFHELGNYHNKISLAAIISREALKKKDPAQLGEDELKALVEKVISNMQKIEQFIVDVDKAIDSFKPYVYKTLDPDVEIPLEKVKEE